MLHGETIHSLLPWDLPWWIPSHAIFFGVLFITVGFIGIGVTIVIIKSFYKTVICKDSSCNHH
ncbi:conserved hypothetical protein [Desulfovibrionales bacterium]